MPTRQKVLKSLPISEVLGELIDKFEQAPYPDSGARYEGYYKTLLSQNQFEVKKQNVFTDNSDISDGSHQVTTKRTYLTSITFMCAGIAGTGTSGNVFQMRNGSATGEIIFEGRFKDGDTDFHAAFPTPIPFPDGLYCEVAVGAVTGEYGLTLVGFTEDA